MFRNVLVIGSSLGFVVSLAGADNASSLPTLSATQIVDKNVAARGGLEAWRAVKTMSLAGKLGAGGNQRSTLQVQPRVRPRFQPKGPANRWFLRGRPRKFSCRF